MKEILIPAEKLPVKEEADICDRRKLYRSFCGGPGRTARSESRSS